jgi:hypothetical protein
MFSFDWVLSECINQKTRIQLVDESYDNKKPKSSLLFERMQNSNEKGYGRCFCGSDSIYYRLNSDIVEIMAIIGREDLNNIL